MRSFTSQILGKTQADKQSIAYLSILLQILVEINPMFLLNFAFWERYAKHGKIIIKY